MSQGAGRCQDCRVEERAKKTIILVVHLQYRRSGFCAGNILQEPGSGNRKLAHFHEFFVTYDICVSN
jgi:hypothetical protein